MTFDDPFRLRALKSLTALLESISIAGGFKHDLAGRVFRGRIHFGDDDVLPMISILEPAVPHEGLEIPEGTPLFNGWLDLIVQGFVDDDSENPTDPAYVLLADVRQALAAEKRRADTAMHGSTGVRLLGMGGKVTDIEIGLGVVRPADETSDKAYFWLSLRLRLVENALTPYSD